MPLRYGQWHHLSELLPHAKVVDELAVRSVHTDAINHDPAITMIQTGDRQPGKPSLGAWLSYGLGSENQNLPAYVVLNSTWTASVMRRPFMPTVGADFCSRPHPRVCGGRGEAVYDFSVHKVEPCQTTRALLEGPQIQESASI